MKNKTKKEIGFWMHMIIFNVMLPAFAGLGCLIFTESFFVSYAIASLTGIILFSEVKP